MKSIFHLPRLLALSVLPMIAGELWTLSTISGRCDDPADTAAIVHVLNRITFGPRPGDVDRVRKMGIHAFIEQQLHPGTIDDSFAESQLALLPMLQMSDQEIADIYLKEKNVKKEQKKEESAVTASDPAAAQAADAASANGNKQAGRRLLLAEAEKEQSAAGTTHTALDANMGKNKNAWSSDAAIEQLEEGKLVMAIDSQRQLQEVLADFWNNHFNVDVKKKICRVYKISDDRDAIRPHIWGKFRDLLGASAHSPAMLYYLDNVTSTKGYNPEQIDAQTMQATGKSAGAMTVQANASSKVADAGVPPKKKNKKETGLNENYAREIMELHTLGVDGGYTQKDVEEVARCFTGWTVDRQTGAFVFKETLHDNGPKVVLGHQIPAGGGIKDGETVLDILASSPATAHHISLELCQRFVSDKPSDDLVKRIAAVFTKTDGDLSQVTEAILTSPEFLSASDYSNKVKSPFEFAVSAVRASGSTLAPVQQREKQFASTEGKAIRGRTKPSDKLSSQDKQSLNWSICEMGEPLFACTPPTGYKEDSTTWVSPGALIGRLNFAMALTQEKLIDVHFDPAKILNGIDIDKSEAVLNQCVATLLPNNISPGTRAVLDRTAGISVAGENSTVDTSKLIALLIGSPEFQRK